MGRTAILGGTGPEGIGLALRLARAGEEVGIGSRDRERAGAAATRVADRVRDARVWGDVNEAVIAEADLVALCFPFSGVEAVVAKNAEALAGKVVIDAVNPLVFKGGVCQRLSVPEGSAGLLIQKLAPRARVVSAFKTISAEHLQHLDVPLEGDVLLCGDDAGAKREVERLVLRIPNLRPLDTGPLANSAAVEGVTALLINLNRRYKAVTSVRIVGIEYPQPKS